ncbi:hypothetical protein OQJ19_06615 [Fluoribacter gormanii]|uniref:Uncharacterized protein n=1 Tax=Fluoribacter gormanii TaxID=464 RepID=A0A377GFY8_9GAMM|nr:hypothetical protein [Fluoribacter gormanii]KTD01706.1 hypothetical protein Lgor_2083 [Fluoribacter gormanii]MCW8445118.1 hypothetical protein [Fluoribacter gormanii]MCW8470328.1 hypothetical protein [Fluoribacter gormanii]SIR79456.1 hypothetical protein SAMN05421777_1257 [Fluoribacter gormanii]STO23312.1 Uncharacterised protein [Fluoribacter gormanii]
MKIQISLKDQTNKEFAQPNKAGDRLDYLAWCLQAANKSLEEKKPLWAVEEIFIQSIEKNSQTNKLYNLGPAKYKELLNRLADIQKGKVQFTSMVLKGLDTDGLILIELQKSDNTLKMEDNEETIKTSLIFR